jgi:hypothetical protein
MNEGLFLTAINKFMNFAHPVGKDVEDELSWHERVQDSLDDLKVRGERDVALKAHIGELGLGRDVDCHVLPKSKVQGVVLEYSVHRVAAWAEEIVVDFHAWKDVVNTRKLKVNR